MAPTPPATDHLQVQRLALRQQFLLRPDVVFLNHGSFGACPRPVFDVYQAWQLDLEHEPVEFLGRRFAGLMRQAREALAAYVGAAADELLYVPNATTGLNIVARSLPLQPGDEVLATDHEYGALDRTWRFVCARRGAKYVNRPLPLPLESPEQVVETLWSAVNERTRVLFISHITSPTALILPVGELVCRARQAGILTVIDGAHTPGQIPLNLTALGADFYSGNCHKWLCAPKGSAFLYARRDVQHLLTPLVVSWGWNREVSLPLPAERAGRAEGLLPLPAAGEHRGDEHLPLPAGGEGWGEGLLPLPAGGEGRGEGLLIAEQEWQGTRDIAAYLSVPAAIQFQAEHEWPRVQAECHELLRKARRRIAEQTPQIKPCELCPDSPEWYAQMASFPLPPGDGPALQRRLYNEYHIEVPVTEWNGRQFVRVSIQGYNTEQDVQTLVEALRELVT